MPDDGPQSLRYGAPPSGPAEPDPRAGPDERLPSAACTVEWHRGRLRLSREAYEACFAPCQAVALVERDGGWWLIPLAAGAGGLLLKLANARGDRVVESQEFFRSRGHEDSEEARLLRLEADAGRAAYRLLGPAAG